MEYDFILCIFLVYKFILKITLIAGSSRTVPGEGMPMHRNPFEKGDLHIKFNITFPPNNFTNEDNLQVYRVLYDISDV